MNIKVVVIGSILGIALHYAVVGLGLLISYAIDKMCEKIRRNRYEKKN